MYGTKQIKKHLLESGRKSQCKQPYELSLICFWISKMCQKYCFFFTFLQVFWNIKSAEWLFFSYWIFVESLGSQWSVPVSQLGLQLVFFELFEEKRCRLVKRAFTNCAFPLKSSYNITSYFWFKAKNIPILDLTLIQTQTKWDSFKKKSYS